MSRVQVCPVTGAQVMAWLIRALDHPDWNGIELEQFDGRTATFLVPFEALAGLGKIDERRRPSGPEEPAESKQSVSLGGLAENAGPALYQSALRETAVLAPWGGRRRLPFLLVVAVLALLAVAALAALTVVLQGRGADGPPAADVPAPRTAGAEISDIERVSETSLAIPTPSILERIERDQSGACIPAEGAGTCDAFRSALWQGDASAWRAWSATHGEPPPTDATVIDVTLGMRLAAGDAKARSDLARAADLSLVQITAVHVEMAPEGRRLVGVEITNLGTKPADIGGMMVPGLGRIGSGSHLPAGEHCALGRAAGVSPCSPQESGQADGLAPLGTNARLVGAEGSELDRMDVP